MKNKINFKTKFRILISAFIFYSPLFAQNFLDTFEDGTTNGWQMGPSPGASNISTGGPDGTDDNYMQLAPDGSGDMGKLIVLNQTQWRGNFNSLGIATISFYANNLSSSSNIDLRIALKKNGETTNDVHSWCATTNSVHLAPSAGWVIVSIDIDAGSLTDLGDATFTVADILADVGQVRILDASSLPAHRGDPSTDLLGLDNITDGNLGPPNTAPMLNWTGEAGFTADGVDPDQASTSDTFTFRATYSDADGDAPAAGYPRLNLLKSGTPVAGSPFTLNQVAGGTFQTGIIYTVDLTSGLAEGTDYTYYFEAEDVNGAAATGDPSSSSNGPVVLAANSTPSLSWTGEAGYTNDGVDPDQGITTTLFTFRIKHTDADGGAPAAGYPRLNLLKGSTAIAGSPFVMTEVNSDPFETGRIYRVDVSSLVEGNDYAYSFESQDIPGTAAIGDPTFQENGPVVTTANNTPLLSWTGEAGLENDGVTPDTASSADIFAFRVRYSDADGDAPASGYPRVNILKSGTPIAGSPFVMTLIGGVSFETGIDYTAVLNGTLTTGNDYTYNFEAQDVNGAAATGLPTTTQSGPVVEGSNSIPVLLWTSESGYTNDGVSPDQGTTASRYIFRVRHADADGGAPAAGYPRLNVFKSGSPVAGSPFVMTAANSDPFETLGRIYSVDVTSLAEGNDYTYSFESQDIPGTAAVGDPVSSSDGPIVSAVNEPFITVNTPDGGDVLVGGEPYNITWYSNNIAMINIDYTIDGGTTWSPVATDLSSVADSGLFEWTVPEIVENEVVLRLSDNGDPGVNVISDIFAIVARYVVVIEPNGGETLNVGDTAWISWENLYESNFTVQFSVDAGATWNFITTVEQTIGSSSEQWVVPDLPSIQCLIRVSDDNNAGVSDVSDAFFTIDQVIDITPPVFIDFDVDPEKIVQGTTLTDTVSVKVQDESAIEQVTLFYKEAGAANYISLIMTLDGVEEYTALIPIDSQNEKGIQLYATAEDEYGNLGTSAIKSISVEFPTTGITNPSPPRAGFDVQDYSLFSIPLDLNDKSVGAFLDNVGLNRNPDGELYRLYAYQNGSEDVFIEYDGSGFPDFIPGRGFFIITSEDLTMRSGVGTTIDASDEYEIGGLQPGWNLIGSPFNFPVPFDSVYAYSNVLNQDIDFDLWEYDNVFGQWRYVDQGNLVPWKGYALSLNSTQNNLSFYIPPYSAAVSSKSAFSTLNNNEQEWMIQITASNGRSKSSFNYIGQLNNAADGEDKFDLVSPPTPGQTVSVSFAENVRQVTDIRKSNNEGHVWDFNCLTTATGKTLTLSFSDISSLNESLEIYLFDKSGQKFYNLRQKNSLDFIAKGATTKSFQVIAGTQEFIAGLENAHQIIPQEFILHNNFPNPFNPQTQITFSLNSKENIKLVIYDVLGQQVAVLQEGVFEAGSYNVIWNAVNQSSGIYFIRLIAGSKIRTIRGVLIK